MDRRFFLKSSGIALAAFGLTAAAPKIFEQVAFAQTPRGGTRRKTLVTIFLRGAADGLNIVVPYGDAEYYRLRPAISIQPPGKTDGAIGLDGHFGLHPAMSSLNGLWKSQRMAIITAAGSPDNTRSHFDAQDYMESGTPGVKSTRDGWLNRALQPASAGDSPFRAVAVTERLPRSLYGRMPAIAMTDTANFSVKNIGTAGDLSGGFESLYARAAAGSIGDTGKETFEAIEFLKKADPQQFRPANGAVYPNTKLGRSLRQIAQLIKAGVGLEAAFAEAEGWDTHVDQGGARGRLANLLRDLSASIAAFAVDLGEKMDDVVVLTMSEFGRTAKENGSRGTDHGHGNVMLAFGNAVRGGKLYGDWKGLRKQDLNEERDIAVTTDFRDIFAEAAAKQLGVRNIRNLFPNFAADRSRFRNFIS